ncbi:hypothetical protein vBEcoMWL3_gp152c [Escherichia phage vB_EcoM_WL-3]|nr:hypothetical protein vBEcoMWL3_gp152c [Escherichia phage vB_EcoM_WL-3]
MTLLIQHSCGECELLRIHLNLLNRRLRFYTFLRHLLHKIHENLC